MGQTPTMVPIDIFDTFILNSASGYVFGVTPGGFREVRDSSMVAPTQSPGGRITLSLQEVKKNAKGRNELRPYQGPC